MNTDDQSWRLCETQARSLSSEILIVVLAALSHILMTSSNLKILIFNIKLQYSYQSHPTHSDLFTALSFKKHVCQISLK